MRSLSLPPRLARLLSETRNGGVKRRILIAIILLITGFLIFKFFILLGWLWRLIFKPLKPLRFYDGNPAEDGVYVYDAYLISNTEIRFLYFAHGNKTTPPMYRIEEEEWVETERILSPPNELPPGCLMHAHLAKAVFDKPYVEQFISLSHNSTNKFFEIRVHDRRPRVYQHELGVFILPMYLMADWPMLVRYFEFWRLRGATKYFIYLHSSTWQVREVLAYYQEVLGDQLEVIPWSDLPVAKVNIGNMSTDPNTQMFHVGHYGTLIDVQMRAKYIVKFLVVADADELLHTGLAEPIPRTLQRLAKEHPNAAAFHFHWQYVDHVDQSPPPATISEVSFMNLKRLRFPRKHTISWGYRLYRKMITRPDRVQLTTFHRVRVYEDHPLNNESYYSTDVPFGSVIHLRPYVLHLRTIPEERQDEFNNTVLGETAYAMQKQLNNNNTALPHFFNRHLDPWYTTFELTITETEVCRQVQYSLQDIKRKRMCSSLGHCREKLSAAHLFSQVQQTWTNIADRGPTFAYAA